PSHLVQLRLWERPVLVAIVVFEFGQGLEECHFEFIRRQNLQCFSDDSELVAQGLRPSLDRPRAHGRSLLRPLLFAHGATSRRRERKRSSGKCLPGPGGGPRAAPSGWSGRRWGRHPAPVTPAGPSPPAGHKAKSRALRPVSGPPAVPTLGKRRADWR